MNTIFFFLPNVAEAGAIPPSVLDFVGKISLNILNPLIALMFGLATAYFIFGVVKYVWDPDNEQAREEGRQSMIWGIIGMVIMVSVFAIMRMIINTIGADISVMEYV